MTRDDMYDLILGAAVVAVGYMLWKQHKQNTNTNTQAGQAAPVNGIPAPPAIQGNDQTGYWWEPDQLLSGVM